MSQNNTHPQDDHEDSDDDVRPEMPFTSLCDDVLMRIFFYLDEHKDRARLEAVNKRFGRLLPLVTENIGDLSERQNEVDAHQSLVTVLGKHPNIKRLDMDNFKMSGLVTDLINTKLNIVEYFANIFEKRPTSIEKLTVFTCDSNLFETKIALEVARYNDIKCIDIDLQSYRICAAKPAIDDFMQLLELCPNLNTLTLTVRQVNAETHEAALSRETRSLMDLIWITLSRKLTTLTFYMYEDCSFPWYGNSHWAARDFVNLKKLTITHMQTPHYIKVICEHCQKLETLDIRSESFDAVDSFSQLEHLTTLDWSYEDEGDLEENDIDRMRNVKKFNKFLRVRGAALKKLRLCIPYQSNDFFAKFVELTPSLRHCAIELVGMPIKYVPTTKYFKDIKGLRELELDYRISTVDFKQIVDNCSKLNTVKFKIAYYEKSLADIYKLMIRSSSSKHRRKICVHIDYFGCQDYPSFDKFQPNEQTDELCELYLNNGVSFRSRQNDWVKD